MARYRLLGPWTTDPLPGFADLRQEIDQLFERFGSPGTPARSGVFPAVNLYDAGDAYVLTAELPGTRPSDLEITLEGTTVTLRGERRIEYGEEREGGLHRAERQAGSFRRAVELPVAIDAERVEAVQKNGILLLHLPKASEHRTRRIAIQGD